MKSNTINLKKIIDYSQNTNDNLKINLISKNHTLNRPISPIEINRPGLSLVGFYDYFAYHRIQVIGQGEYAYLKKIKTDSQKKELKKMFSYEIPCFIFSHKNIPPNFFIEMAKEKKIPVAVSELETGHLIKLIKNSFRKILAPKIIYHGVMMELYGMGVLVTGEHGIGKSECCLEIIEKGHLFIADDVIDIRLLENNALMASGSKVIAHHMEIQGIGIINIAHLFGVGSIRNEKEIDLIIHLETYEAKKHYERIGLKTNKKEILGVKIPIVTIPIQPGTNLPVLIETATMNQRLKTNGYNTAKEFSKKLIDYLEEGKNIF